MNFFFVLLYRSGLSGVYANDLSGMIWSLLGFGVQYYLLFFYIAGFILVDIGLERVNEQIQDKVEAIELAQEVKDEVDL